MYSHVELFINITQKSQATNIVLNMHMMIKKTYSIIYPLIKINNY